MDDEAGPGSPPADGEPLTSGESLLSVAAQMPFGQAVGFLVSQLGHMVTRRFKTALEGLSLEPRHFGLMRAIYTAGRPSQQTLAEILHIPASSVVALVDQLVQKDLVRRGHDPSDRRVRLVELTATGKETLVKAIKIGITLESALCSGLSPGEREALIAQLQRVASNMDLTMGVHPGFSEVHAPTKPEGCG